MSIQFLSLNSICQLCKNLDIKPTKTLGQNFVKDKSTVQKIVSKIGDIENKHVIEIGPGLGSLTLAILEKKAYISAVEIDPKLAKNLPVTIQKNAPDYIQRIRVLNDDALKIEGFEDLEKSSYCEKNAESERIFSLPPEFLIANLPYNVSVPIILNILEKFPSIHTVLVMVQLEVAQRLTAKPENKIYGVPSIKLAWYGEAKMVGKIGTAVFYPVPNVDSALVLFNRREKEFYEKIISCLQCSLNNTATDDFLEQLRKTLFDLVDTAFSQRRKMLRQSVKPFCASLCTPQQLLEESGIDPRFRAEMLSVDDYIKIAETYLRIKKYDDE